MASASSNRIAPSMLALVGDTPMVYLNRVTEGCVARVAVKLEAQEPCGSVKDRIGKAMLDDAEARGVITPGVTTIIEPTSGNTGIALAFAAAVKGYKAILVMPESFSMERRVLLRAFGADIVLTPREFGIPGALRKAKEMLEEIPNSWMPNQFANPANPAIHYNTTGPEIWRDSAGEVDIFIGGVGTGGTISGAVKYLKEQKPSVKAYAVEPVESPVLSGGKPGPHLIQGIGAGFKPDTYDGDVVDGVIQVSSQTALVMARRLPREEGIFCGISSGAAIHCAVEMAKQPENEGKLIVVVEPSFGERYLSTALFKDLFDECAAMPTSPCPPPPAAAPAPAPVSAPAPAADASADK